MNWPKDPDRERVARALLNGRRVSALVRGREPVVLSELTRMLATATGISTGMAAAAVARAIEVGEVDCLIVLPAEGERGPDADTVLDALAEGAEALERARREAAGRDQAQTWPVDGLASSLSAVQGPALGVSGRGVWRALEGPVTNPARAYPSTQKPWK